MKIVIWAVVVSCTLSTQVLYSQTDKPTGASSAPAQSKTEKAEKRSDKKTAGDKAADDKSAKEKALEFVRVQKEGKKLQAMQTAVVTYSNPTDPNSPKITLIGAVHVGESEYYSNLNNLFRQYDSLLFEMVMDPADGVPDPEQRGVSPVSTIQVGMKDALGLAFQLDEVDYKAKNFVHADMTPQEMT
jgi:ribosomal protein S8E